MYRLKEILSQKKTDKDVLKDLFFVLEKTSFCSLGRNISLPFKSLFEKIIYEQEI